MCTARGGACVRTEMNSAALSESSTLGWNKSKPDRMVFSTSASRSEPGPAKGECPYSSSYATQPRDQMSTYKNRN